MRWRSSLAVLLALIAALGPGVVMLLRYGARAKLQDIGADDPILILTILALLLSSTILALASASLIRREILADVRSAISAIVRRALKHA